MAKLRNKPANAEAAPAPESIASEPEGAEQARAGSTTFEMPSRKIRKPRIIVHFDSDGKPDLSALDPDTKANLQTAFQATAPAPQEQIDPELVAMVLKGLGSVEAAILAGRFQIDLETCRRIVGPPEPQATMISTAAARVIMKYNLTGRYADEIALLCLITTWQLGTIQQLRVVAKANADEKRRGMGQAPAREEHVSPSPSSIEQ